MNTKKTDSIPAQNRSVQGLEGFRRSCKQGRNLKLLSLQIYETFAETDYL